MNDILSLLGHGAQAGEPAEKHYGLYAGVVVNREDPDCKARVQINLPWIQSDFETLWAPVTQIYAGDGYGAYWIPEVGDQVIVAFLRGDLRKPIVLGSIYSRDRKPDLGIGDGQDPKVLRTQSGHMLLMEEGDSPLIKLVDQTGGNEVEINSADNIVTVRAADHVIVEAGGNVQVEAGGSASVQAGQDLSIQASGNITIEASGTLTLSGATVAIN